MWRLRHNTGPEAARLRRVLDFKLQARSGQPRDEWIFPPQDAAVINLDIFRGVVWVLDWRGRIDVIEHQLTDCGWVGVMISLLLNPSPWTVFIVLPLGLFLIYWDLRRSREFKLEPWHVIALGLVIAAFGVVWQVNRGQPISAAMHADATPKKHIPISGEETRFRIDLRKFVFSYMDDDYQKMAGVFGGLLRSEQARTISEDPLMYFVNVATSSEQLNKLPQLKEMARIDINNMDVKGIQDGIVFRDYPLDASYCFVHSGGHRRSPWLPANASALVKLRRKATSNRSRFANSLPRSQMMAYA